MKAVFYHEHGDNSVLQYGDFETPEPGPGQVLVAVKAAALNRLDLWVRTGWPGIKLTYPHIPGADGAGIVAALGEGVSEFAVGDRVVINGTMSDGSCEMCLAGQDNLCVQMSVLGEHDRGTCAEYIALPARNLMRVPEGFPLEEAAAASLVYLTAWHSLITRGGLQAGESVLIIGAGGGVNTASIQIAKLTGAKVYVVGSGAEKLAQAEALGADVLINRNEEDWGKAIFKLTDRRGVDVVVDNVGQATLNGSMRAVRRGGRILVVGGTSGYQTEIGVNYIFAKHISIIGSTMSTRADFEQVMSLIFEGKLKAVVDSVRPLSEAKAAFELLESGEDIFGKLVLAP